MNILHESFLLLSSLHCAVPSFCVLITFPFWVILRIWANTWTQKLIWVEGQRQSLLLGWCHMNNKVGTAILTIGTRCPRLTKLPTPTSGRCRQCTGDRVSSGQGFRYPHLLTHFSGLDTNSIFFCTLFIKNQWTLTQFFSVFFAWMANQWPLVRETLFSSVPPSNSLVSV